jgi:hypothetical protein
MVFYPKDDMTNYSKGLKINKVKKKPGVKQNLNNSSSTPAILLTSDDDNPLKR